MKKIVICGTGDFAREVFSWLKLSEKNQEIEFKGFLDLSDENLVKTSLEKYYLGNENEYVFEENEYVLIAITDSKIKRKIVTLLESRNVNFMNYIHESVIIGENVSLGKGNIICPNSVLTTGINIKDFNIFNLFVSLGHDVSIDSFNVINSHCDITGYSKIGSDNFFGSRVTTLPASKIGNNNKIAAGSVIYKGIRDNLIYMGNPAKKISENN